MNAPIKYLAAPVPRYLRQTRLAYLPLNTVIGSRTTKQDDGSNFIFDFVMLPDIQFQRMRTNVGLQHVAAPSLSMGGGIQPGFVLAEVRHVTVPDGELDPVAYARNYFIEIFKLEKTAS